MKHILIIFGLIFIFLFQTSCATKPLDEVVNSTDSLVISLPNQFNLKLVKGYKNIKGSEYYFEASRWLSGNKKIDFYIEFTNLAEGYVFGANTQKISEVLIERFEDRIIEKGEIERISNVEILPFEIMDADCHFFRKFFMYGPKPDIVFYQKHDEVYGDAKVAGYLCDYAKSGVSKNTVAEFVGKINTKKVSVYKKLKELKD